MQIWSICSYKPQSSRTGRARDIYVSRLHSISAANPEVAGFCSGGKRAVTGCRPSSKRSKLIYVARCTRRLARKGVGFAPSLMGYFNYHAVPTNINALSAFRFSVLLLWHRTLRRRSQVDRRLMENTKRHGKHWLPAPRILHPWPNQRFAVKHEPSARIEHART